MTAFLTGIDTSQFQGLVDWPRVRAAGFIFAFAKATEGLGWVDKQFARSWPAMKAASLLRSPYHFFRPSVDPEKQIEHFRKVVGDYGEPGDLMPMVDFEAHDGMCPEQIIPRAKAAMEATEALFQRWPIGYHAEWFWRGWLGGEKAAVLRSWPLMIADYDVPKPNLLGWPDWLFWQHDVAEAGVVPGIPRPAKCDLDYFRGTLAELRALAGIGSNA